MVRHGGGLAAAALLVGGAAAQTLDIGVYGPMTSISLDFLATAVIFQYDVMKYWNSTMVADFGNPIVSIADFNSSLEVTTQIGNSHSVPDQGIGQALQLMQGSDGRSPITGLVGGYHSAISMPVANLATWLKVPQISFGSTNAKLSNKDQYPWFLRTIPPDSIQGAGMWRFIKHFSVPKVTFLYAQEAYAEGLMQTVADLAATVSESFRITSVGVMYMPSNYDAAEARAKIKLALAGSSKVFFVAMTTDQGAGFWPVAAAEGMLGTSYQVVGSEALPLSSDATSLPVGYMYFSPESRGPLFSSFSAMWAMMTPDRIVSSEVVDTFGLDHWLTPLTAADVTAEMFTTPNYGFALEAPFIFDACYAFVVATNNLMNAGTSLSDIIADKKLLLDELKTVSFEGISGQVQFNAQGDRLASYSVTNVQLSGGSKTAVAAGVYDSATDAITIVTGQSLYWMDGVASTTVPEALVSCRQGYYKDADLLCQPCAAGTVTNAAQDGCEPCPFGKVAVDDAVTGVRTCEYYEIEIGCYGPFTSVSMDFLTTAIAFDIDFRKNHDSALRARFGQPVVTVPNLNSNLRIRLQIGNSDSDPDVGVGTNLELFQGDGGRRPIVALIGGYHSAISMPVANLATQFKVTQVSFGSTSPALSNKGAYPYFLRTIPPDSIQGMGMWTFIKEFGVPAVTFVYAQEPYAAGLYGAVASLAVEAGEGFRINPVGIKWMPKDYDAAVADQAVQTVIITDFKVVFVAMTSDQGAGFWTAANTGGLLGGTYQIIGSEALPGLSPLWNGVLPPGYMYFSPQSRGPLFSAFDTFYKKLTLNDVNGTGATPSHAEEYYGINLFKVAAMPGSFPTNAQFVAGAENIALEAPYLFDAGYSIVVAANMLLNNNIPPTAIKEDRLHKAVKAVAFDGISGEVRFNDVGDRLAAYSIMNLQGAVGSVVAADAAVFNSATKTIDFKTGMSFTWMDGTVATTVPKPYTACKQGSYKDNTGRCSDCPEGLVANDDQTLCVQCPAGLVPVTDAVSGARFCDYYPIQIGAYGPITSVSVDFLLTAVAFDLDFRKNHDAALATRLGPPVVAVPNLNANLRIKLQIGTSHSTPDTGVGTCMELFGGEAGRTKIAALIGGYHSAISMPVATLATQYKVTQVSFGSTNPGLSNKDAYPYFLRTIPPDSIQGLAMWAFIKGFRVPAVTVLYAQEPYGQGLHQAIVDEATKAGENFRITSVGIKWMPNEYLPSVAAEAIDGVMAQAAKVVIVIMTSDQGDGLFPVAKERGLLTSSYQIVGSEALPFGRWETVLPTGYMWFSPQSRGPLFDQFDGLWKKMLVEDVTGAAATQEYGIHLFKEALAGDKVPTQGMFSAGADGISLEAPYLFDAGYSFVFAANALINGGHAPPDVKDESLLEAVKAVSFEGISGKVKFDGNGDRLASYFIMNAHPLISGGRRLAGGVTIVRAATFDAVASQVTPTDPTSMYWMAGSAGSELPDTLTACKPGFMKNTATFVCERCAPGWWSSGVQVTECNKCEKGTMADDPEAATGCLTCPRGRYSENDGETNCTLCGSGFFAASDGATECLRCDVGFYQPDEGSHRCNRCRSKEATSVLGARSIDDCVCEEGYYRTGPGGECMECLEGMECPFGSDVSLYNSWNRGGRSGKMPSFPLLKPSHMALADNPLSVYKCSVMARCPGGAPGVCGPQLDTSVRACAHCTGEMYWDGESCQKCSAVETSGFVFPVLPILLGPPLLCLLYYISMDDADKWGNVWNAMPTYLFLLLNHYQVTSLSGAANLQYSSSLIGFLNTYAFALDPAAIFKPECAGFRDFGQNMTLKAFTPIIVFAVLLATFAGSFAVAKLTRRPLRFDINRTLNLYFSIIFMFFAAISSMALELFKCTPNPNEENTLAGDQSIVCGEKDWNGLVVIAVFAVIVYIAGFGGLFLRIIMIAPRNFSNVIFQRRWKFLFIKFRPDVWWWATVVCAKGVWMNIGFTFMSLGIAQLYWVMATMGFYCLAVIYFMPWRNRTANAMDVYMHFALMFLCSLLAFYVHGFPEELKDTEVAIAAVAIIINISPIFAAGILYGRLWYKRKHPVSQAKQMKDLHKLMPAILAFARAPEGELLTFMSKLDEWGFYHIVSALHVISTEFLGQGYKARLSDGTLKSTSSGEKIMSTGAAKPKEPGNTPAMVVV